MAAIKLWVGDDDAYEEMDGHEDEEEELLEIDDETILSAKRKVSIRTLPGIAVTAFLLMVDSSVMSFIAPLLIDDLGLTTSSYGTLIACYYMATCASQIPSSIIAGRFGLKRYLPVVLLLHGLLVVFSGLFVYNFMSLIVCRVLTGAVVGSTMSSMMAHVALFFTSSEVGKAWARSQNIGAPLGLVIGGPLAAFVLYIVNGNPIAWRGVFILEGILFLLAAPFIFIFMPLAPDKCDSFLTPLESAFMKRQAEEVQAEKRRRSAKIATAVGEQQVMVELLRDARILLLALTACLRRIAVYGQMFYTPLILEAAGLSVSTVAWLVSLFLVASLLFGQYWAYRSDLMKERVFHASAGIVLMIVGLGGTAFCIQTDAALWIQVILLTLARMGIYSFYIPFSAFQMDVLPKNASQLGLAFIAMSGNVAGFVGSYLIGLIQQGWGIPAGLYFMAVASCLSLMAFLPLSLFSKHQRIPGGDHDTELGEQLLSKDDDSYDDDDDDDDDDYDDYYYDDDEDEDEDYEMTGKGL